MTCVLNVLRVASGKTNCRGCRSLRLPFFAAAVRCVAIAVLVLHFCGLPPSALVWCLPVLLLIGDALLSHIGVDTFSSCHTLLVRGL